jgi:hypothetical protein
VDRYVSEQLDASDRNLKVASDLIAHVVDDIGGPAFEWVVVVSFYCAVRSMNAYLGSRVGVVPRSHVQRSRAIQNLTDLRSIIDLYTRLENWSRDARYTSTHTAFDENLALTALESARSIREHIRAHLPTTRLPTGIVCAVSIETSLAII